MEAKIISDTEPTNNNSGKMWIKPSNSIFIKLGSIFIPLVSGIPNITFSDITVLINGIDMSLHVERGTLQITDNIKDEVNECSFNLVNPSSIPVVGQEVIVYYKKNLTNPIVIFGGKILTCPQSQLAIGKFIYEIDCTDYTQELSKKLVVEVYEAEDAGEIIKDIIQTYVPELGTYFVTTGLEITYIAFNYMTALECIIQIADLCGYYWYVDYERQLHFFPIDTNTAPYNIDETSASGEYGDLQIEIDKSQIKNVIYIRGGYELSSLYSQEKVADGTQLSFPLDYTPFAPMKIYVNIGAGYVEHSLGIDNIDTSGKDFVVNVSEKVIRNLDHLVLTAGHILKITYKYEKPILISAENNASIQTMATYEGGDGKYEYLISDDTIQSKETAYILANSELNKYSNPKIQGSFKTIQYGYKSGQILSVHLPTRGINNQEYIIQSVTAISLGNGNFEYEVVFATISENLPGFLIDLYNSSKTVIDRTDEILNILRYTESEELTISDSITKTALRNVSTNPFVWSNDGGTTPDAGRWNLCEWS